MLLAERRVERKVWIKSNVQIEAYCILALIQRGSGQLDTALRKYDGHQAQKAKLIKDC